MASVFQMASIDPPSDAQVDEVLKALDTDMSETIDLKEFKDWIKKVLDGLADA